MWPTPWPLPPKVPVRIQPCQQGQPLWCEIHAHTAPETYTEWSTLGKIFIRPCWVTAQSFPIKRFYHGRCCKLLRLWVLLREPELMVIVHVYEILILPHITLYSHFTSKKIVGQTLETFTIGRRKRTKMSKVALAYNFLSLQMNRKEDRTWTERV